MQALLALAFLLVPPATSGPAPAPDRTLRVDAVDLLRGAETPGLAEFSERRAQFTYWFASEANRAAFRADPARYEIQLGGACARMGPLSGEGSTAIHAVHAGRLYVFASPACRTGFLKAPEKLLETRDPRPEATPEQRARGAELLSRALSWIGGADAVDAVRTLVVRQEADKQSGERTYRVVKSVTHDFLGGRARDSVCWDEECWSSVLWPARAARVGADAVDFVPVQRLALERKLGRDVLAVLRRRSAPDALVHHSGTGTLGGRAVEWVTLWSADTATGIAVDPADGAIVGLRTTGRGPSAALGTVEEVLLDWRSRARLKLPYRSEVTFDGERQPDMDLAATSIDLDLALDPRLFEG